MLRCGASETVITPELGSYIPGHYSARTAVGKKSDLFAHTLVLDDGKNIIALISLDIIGLSDRMTDNIRTRANELTGIPKGNIMVAATHNHTGGAVDFPLYFVDADPAISGMTAMKAADSVKMAFDRLAPAKLGFGSCEEYDIAFNRRFIMKDGTVRTNPGMKNPDLKENAGPQDPEVGVIRIDNEDGSPLAIAVNFACHLDVAGGFEFCADFPGEMRRVLRSTYGDIPVIFFSGCCGDINHVDFWGKHPLERGTHYLKMGRILAGDVIAVREKIITTDEVEVGAASEIVTGKRRQPTEEDVAWAKQYLTEHPEFEFKSEYIYANSYIDLYENPILTQDYEIQALKIGNIGISAMPSETFVEIGLEIKKDSPFENNFTVELANGCIGYVATELAMIQKGGYETKLSKYIYMDENAAKQHHDTAVKLLKKL